MCASLVSGISGMLKGAFLNIALGTFPTGLFHLMSLAMDGRLVFMLSFMMQWGVFNFDYVD